MSAGNQYADLFLSVRQIGGCSRSTLAMHLTRITRRLSPAVRHEAIGPMLGTDRDTEADASGPLNGFGDDVTRPGGSDDEDGIEFASPAIVVGQPNLVSATISGSLGNARLNAWVDFNDDGDFDDASEQIADGTGIFAGLSDGTVNVTFTPPADAATGLTYSRFRVSTDEGIGVGGLASDGEVEDYRVCLVNQSGGAAGVCQVSDSSAGFESSFVESSSSDGTRILFHRPPILQGRTLINSSSCFFLTRQPEASRRSPIFRWHERPWLCQDQR